MCFRDISFQKKTNTQYHIRTYACVCLKANLFAILNLLFGCKTDGGGDAWSPIAALPAPITDILSASILSINCFQVSTRKRFIMACPVLCSCFDLACLLFCCVI